MNLWRVAIDERSGRVTGEHAAARWFNVGTPAGLERVDAELRMREPRFGRP